MMFLAILTLEFSSVGLTSVINRKNELDAIVNIGEMGYKIDLLALKQGNINPAKVIKKMNDIARLTHYIPIVNVLTALSMKKTSYDLYYQVVEPCLIPMTEEEHEKFINAKSLEEKMKLMVNNSYTADDIIEKWNKKGYEVCIELNFNKLLPLSYTYNEVLELAKAYDIYVENFKTLFCESDGRNIAIIGLPENVQFSLISYADQRKNVKYDFKEYTEEEAKNQKYVVYPFTSEDLFREKIDSIIDEIRNKRVRAYSYIPVNAHQGVKKLERKK